MPGRSSFLPKNAFKVNSSHLAPFFEMRVFYMFNEFLNMLLDSFKGQQKKLAVRSAEEMREPPAPLRMRKSFGRAILDVIKGPRMLSLTKAQAWLKEHDIGMDLEKVCEDDVKSMIRWGGFSGNSKDELEREMREYQTALSKLEISEEDLEALERQVKTNPDIEQRVVVGVDTMMADQAFVNLLCKPGIADYYRYKNTTRKVLAILRPLYDIVGAPLRFSDYDRRFVGNQSPTGRAGILFTPNIYFPANSPWVSPNEYFRKMMNGQKYMGPVGWIKLLRQTLDRMLSGDFSPRDLDKLSFPPSCNSEEWREHCDHDDYVRDVQRMTHSWIAYKFLHDLGEEHFTSITKGTLFPDLRTQFGDVLGISTHQVRGGKQYSLTLHELDPNVRADKFMRFDARPIIGNFTV